MERKLTTLLEAVAYFSDPDRAHEYAVQQRWPNGVACPRMGCGNANVQYIATRKSWRCKECKRTFTAKVGTIFEESPIPFTKWMPAVWLIVNAKNGNSSCELARAIGVTQKTAWFMLHRIRVAMHTEDYERLTGEVEADETYVGGKPRRPNVGRANMNRKKKADADGKAVVFGMRERGGRVRAFVVRDSRRATLLPALYENVAKGSTLYTDALRSYEGLNPGTYRHFIINHAERYVQGRVHTNNIENFWSVLKRTIGGTYIAPRPFHLDAYLDEQVFRFNEREDNDGGRFVKALRGTDGRRLTYKVLTSKEGR
jgi:transposase-like protein